MNTTLVNKHDEKRITTALLLAAGTGSRLFPLTKSSPKCLTLLNEISILDRLLVNLKKGGFKKLVVVTGYLKESIMEYLGEQSGNISIEYIHSPLYKTTNNIYSLWMARDIIKEPFVLFESDLVFDGNLLENMMYPDRMAIALMQPWLNGTTVTINEENKVIEFQNGTTDLYTDVRYKTVNIYSFSLRSWQSIVEKLEVSIANGNVNSYYETVFAEMVKEESLSLQSVSFDDKPWYEVDTIEDLEKATLLFPKELEEVAYLATL